MDKDEMPPHPCDTIKSIKSGASREENLKDSIAGCGARDDARDTFAAVHNDAFFPSTRWTKYNVMVIGEIGHGNIGFIFEATTLSEMRALDIRLSSRVIYSAPLWRLTGA